MKKVEQGRTFQLNEAGSEYHINERLTMKRILLTLTALFLSIAGPLWSHATEDDGSRKKSKQLNRKSCSRRTWKHASENWENSWTR